MSNNTPTQNSDSTENSTNSQNSQTKIPTTGFAVNSILEVVPDKFKGLKPHEVFAQIQKEKEEEKALEQEKEAMRQKKFAVLAKYSEFENENIRNHPPISTIVKGKTKEEKEQFVENLDVNTISQYVARQNIVCTFYCDEVLTTGPERVDELAKIFTSKTEEKFTHLTLWTSDRPGFAEEWENKKKNDPNYASQYFLVHLHNEPQNKEELDRFVQEFKEICNNFINKNDKK